MGSLDREESCAKVLRYKIGSFVKLRNWEKSNIEHRK